MATALAVRRAGREAKAVKESKHLEDMGIYYLPDESNAMKGTAMLVGKEGTPYVGGYYFFDIQFPDDYPFSPMKVNYLTQDGKTRFNPNLYLCGKVCLSILNTWQGPSWNVVHTLETVLVSIMSMVLNEYPIANEPGYESQIKTKTCQDYNRVVFHANVKTAILAMITSTPKFAVPFMEQMTKELEKNKEMIQKALQDNIPEDGKRISGVIFGLSCNYEFRKMLNHPLLKPETETLEPEAPEIKVSETTDASTLPPLPTLGLGKIVKDEEKKNVLDKIPLPALPELTELPKSPKIVAALKLVLKKHPKLDNKQLIADNSDCKDLIFSYDRSGKTTIVWCTGKIFLDCTPEDVSAGVWLQELNEEEIKTVNKYGIKYMFGSTTGK
jgi:ubiquitin-protein ligase